MNLSAAYLQKQQDWKEEGRQESRQEVAIALLQAGIDLDLIAQTTGVPIEALRKLRSP